ncbi:MAG: glycosyltransferase [Patescibacteria group bacterium]|nr:glycosyltransferase [Patescibacteria group bacterium]
MKIGIYTPYLDSFGGGERYILTVAEIFSSQNSVDLLLDNHLNSLNPKQLVEDLAGRFKLDLSRVNLVPAPIGKGSKFLERLFFLRKYDLIFYLTDGSIFYSTAKKNIIHFQVPFKNSSHGFLGKLKLSTWNLAVCNSQFTREYIQQQWPIKNIVIYPPVDIENMKPLKKEKYILSVGRFASFTKSKKHEEMIEAFGNLTKSSKIKGWSLHLAGSLEGDEGYIEELKQLAKDLPVCFYPNLSFDKLMELYGQSSIYWHAAGLGETDPAKMEHFGITTVEAMAGGCVPVVINLGGQKEIVEDGISGLLWNTIEELKSKTLELIDNPGYKEELAQKARERSRKFSKENFQKQIKEIVHE